MNRLPPLVRYSFQELGRMTAEADDYLNSSTRHREQTRRAKEVIEKLNTHIQHQYLHQPVNVYGIHKKMGHDKAGNLHVYLKDGGLEGLSDGFIVVDFASDFDNIGAETSRNQADLLASLQEFAPGRYAVSHLVKLFTIEGHSDDFLLQQTLVARGFAPAFASEIFPEEQSGIPVDSELLESERIRALNTDSARRQIDHIEGLLEEASNPLGVLVNHARKFRGMKPSDQYSFRRIINANIANNIAGRKYKFNDGLPLYFERQEDGSGSGPISLNTACDVLIADLDSGPHYEVNWAEGFGGITDESALYAVGYLIHDGDFVSQPLVIPLEQLKGLEILPDDE